jgi:hypothetical protein
VEQARAERSSLIVCAACHMAVTSSREQIDCNGAHVHAFLNPAGVVYRIRCFATAPGVVPAGEASDYWTWFPGFRWQACLCKACFQHLGWSFRNADVQFFGLIADRVLELEEPGSPPEHN